MELKNLYREIVNEHNLHPVHKGDIEDPDMILNGVNPSCGDDIYLQLKFDENGNVSEGSFNGSGCAISQASADMMLDLIIGLPKEEALEKAEIFMGMVRGTVDEEKIEELDEAASLADIAHMPARVKCATLGWKTMQRMLRDGENEKK
ncbi:MAG: SUF system NifU family Fe-S cluster assembly protein [Lachnospiraceae bacterium]|jgi:nitrogen fixation NifU-like protein|nr:SUF system NifU family Fe-S cluster assembly protein [Lachnospiraceae bacterium]